MNVYDFDHTIYAGDSSVDFFLFSILRRPALALLLPLQVAGMLLGRLVSKEAMKAAFFLFLRFIPAEAFAAAFWEKARRKLRPWYLARKRSDDVIISASPDFLLRPLVEGVLGARLIASPVDPHTGRFTGRNCRGVEKARRFAQEFPEADVAEIVIEEFYSDSVSDAPLARKARRAFLVRRGAVTPWNDAEKKSILARLRETYFSKAFLLFVFCGGMGTLTNFVFSLAISSRINPTIAYIAGYAISLLVAYALNAHLIFHHPLSAGAFARFIVSYLPNFCILFAFVLIFLNVLDWNKVIVYALAGTLGLPVTFVLVKLFAFGKRKTTGERK